MLNNQREREKVCDGRRSQSMEGFKTQKGNMKLALEMNEEVSRDGHSSGSLLCTCRKYKKVHGRE